MGHNSGATTHKFTLTRTDKYKATLTFTVPCNRNTKLFEMFVGVLITCHTQYT